MKYKSQMLVGSVLLACAVHASAASSIDLRVTGTWAPGACLPNIPSNVVDFGKINVGGLSKTGETQLTPKTVAYQLICSAPTAVGIIVQDSRPGTASNVQPTHYGLGLSNTKKVGYYTITQAPGVATGDSNTVDLIQRDGTAGVWTASTNGIQLADGTRENGYAATGTVVPGVYTNVSGTLTITPSIAEAASLDLTKEVVLDGLATMEVRYL